MKVTEELGPRLSLESAQEHRLVMALRILIAEPVLMWLPPPRALRSALGLLIYGHGPVGLSPEENHKDDQRIGAPVGWA